jgi:predicted helicase
MMTGKDNFMIAWTKEEMTERMKDIADLRIPDEIIREKYSLEDSRDWVLKEARSAGFNPALVVPVNYRPFDIRWTYYHKHMHASLQRRVNDLMVGGDNIALCVPRQLSSLPFEHAFVTCNVTEMCCVSNRGKEANRVFPLNVAAGANQLLSDLQESNLASQYLASLHRLLSSNGKVAQPTPEEGFGYVYAILHSSRYRSRYEQFLKNDFPRIPMLASYELFHLLSKIGRQLIGTHLLRFVVRDQKTATFIGTDQAVIEKISWSADTVWVNKVESMGFKGVSEAVWNFHVGGYQVCDKWLKDRKGRTLSDEDIAHYQKIVVALSETIRLMKEIDEVIEHHGGWPGAFVGAKVAN